MSLAHISAGALELAPWQIVTALSGEKNCSFSDAIHSADAAVGFDTLQKVAG